MRKPQYVVIRRHIYANMSSYYDTYIHNTYYFSKSLTSVLLYGEEKLAMALRNPVNGTKHLFGKKDSWVLRLNYVLTQFHSKIN